MMAQTATVSETNEIQIGGRVVKNTGKKIRVKMVHRRKDTLLSAHRIRTNLGVGTTTTGRHTGTPPYMSVQFSYIPPHTHTHTHMAPEFPLQISHTLCSPTGETVLAKAIHRQPHDSNLLEEREVDIQLDTPRMRPLYHRRDNIYQCSIVSAYT